MLLSTDRHKGCLKLVVLALKVFGFISGCLLVDYNKKTGRFYPQGPKEIANVKKKLVIYWIFTLSGILQTIYLWHSLSSADFLQCVFYVIFSVVAIAVVHDHLKNMKEVPALFNCMLDWEAKKIADGGLISTAPSKRKKFCVILVKILVFGGPFVPLSDEINMLKEQCVPTQFGNIFQADCNSASSGTSIVPPTSILYDHPIPLPNIVVRAMVYAMICYSRMTMLMSFDFQLGVGIALIPMCLHNYIQQANSRKFSLSEGYERYNQLQIMVKLYNDIYKRSTAGMLIFIVCEAATSMFGCIKLWGIIPVERYIVFAYAATAVFACALPVYGQLAGIQDESIIFLRNFKQRAKRHATRSKYETKLAASLPPLRIMLGSSNFVDADTPITCQQLIFEHTSDLMLLS